DISLLTETGDPAFLNLLRFVLDQLLLDVASCFGQRSGGAAAFVLHLQDVVIAGVIDDVADSADRHVEGELFQRPRESVASDPAPIAAVVFGAVLGINL